MHKAIIPLIALTCVPFAVCENQTNVEELSVEYVVTKEEKTKEEVEEVKEVEDFIFSPYAKVEVSAPTTKPNPPTIEYTKKDLRCLAMNIYHEARGEPIEGQIAVADVTISRVFSRHYPDNICEVVYERFAFSWTLNKNTTPKKKELYSEIKVLSKKVLEGEVEPVTPLATHYHTTEVDPEWKDAFKVVALVGNHIFYDSGGVR